MNQYIVNIIHVVTESTTNGYNIVTLDIISFIAILCGVFVIVSKNPIVSVLFLIGLFLSISAYLMVLGLNFIGLSYLLVYVGAVSILFLFILMLINVRISEIVSTTSNSIPLAIIIGTLFYSGLYKALPLDNNLSSIIYSNTHNNVDYLSSNVYALNIIYVNIKIELATYYNSIINFFKSGYNNSDSINMSNLYELSTDSYNTLLYLTYSHNWDNVLAEVSHINTLGNILYTSFSLWILLTSLILLLAMVGAIVITIRN